MHRILIVRPYGTTSMTGFRDDEKKAKEEFERIVKDYKQTIQKNPDSIMRGTEVILLLLKSGEGVRMEFLSSKYVCEPRDE